LVIFLPNLVWESRNGYPTIALLHTVIGTKVRDGLAAGISRATIPTGKPAGCSDMAGRIVFFLFDQRGRKYAVLGIAYLVVLLEMIVLHGKIYYVAPAYIMLLAEERCGGSKKCSWPVALG